MATIQVGAENEDVLNDLVAEFQKNDKRFTLTSLLNLADNAEVERYLKRELVGSEAAALNAERDKKKGIKVYYNLSCSDLLPSLFFQHPTTHFAPTRCCPINWDFLRLGVCFFSILQSLTFPPICLSFRFRRTPVEIQTLGTHYLHLVLPLCCCLCFRCRTTFRDMVSFSLSLFRQN